MVGALGLPSAPLDAAHAGFAERLRAQGGDRTEETAVLQRRAGVDAQLVVRIATPGAIKSFPFKLENVPLP